MSHVFSPVLNAKKRAGAGLHPARAAAPSAGRLDQGRRRAAGCANAPAPGSAGGGRTGPRLNCPSHLPLAYDVCR